MRVIFSYRRLLGLILGVALPTLAQPTSTATGAPRDDDVVGAVGVIDVDGIADVDAPETAIAPAAAAPETAIADPQASCPLRQRWPRPDWEVLPATMTSPAHAAAVAALEAYAFTFVEPDAARLGIRTDSVVIIKDGAIIYERYARGFNAQSKHLAWSMTKSLMGVTTGVAVRDGLLSTSDSICTWIPDLPKASCSVTVDNLLQMGSGFDWHEDYEDGQSRQTSSVLAALYGQGQRDIGRFNARHALRDPPGSSWLYSSGDTATLALVLKAAMKERYGDRYLWPAVFDPIGATRVTVEQDGIGNFVGGSYWYASARDAARLGYLALNDGCWNTTRILPEGWMQKAVTPNEAFASKRLKNDREDVYGRLWWLNRAVPEAGLEQPFPDVPADFYAARGHWGQSIGVVPSKDLIIVRFADDREKGILDFNRFHQLAIAVADATELP